MFRFLILIAASAAVALPLPKSGSTTYKSPPGPGSLPPTTTQLKKKPVHPTGPPKHRRPVNKCECDLDSYGKCPCFRDMKGNLIEVKHCPCNTNPRLICSCYSSLTVERAHLIKQVPITKVECPCDLDVFVKCPCFVDKKTENVVMRKPCPCEKDPSKTCNCFVVVDESGEETEERFLGSVVGGVLGGVIGTAIAGGGHYGGYGGYPGYGGYGMYGGGMYPGYGYGGYGGYGMYGGGMYGGGMYGGGMYGPYG